MSTAFPQPQQQQQQHVQDQQYDSDTEERIARDDQDQDDGDQNGEIFLFGNPQSQDRAHPQALSTSSTTSSSFSSSSSSSQSYPSSPNGRITSSLFPVHSGNGIFPDSLLLSGEQQQPPSLYASYVDDPIAARRARAETRSSSREEGSNRTVSEEDDLVSRPNSDEWILDSEGWSASSKDAATRIDGATRRTTAAGRDRRSGRDRANSSSTFSFSELSRPSDEGEGMDMELGAGEGVGMRMSGSSSTSSWALTEQALSKANRRLAFAAENDERDNEPEAVEEREAIFTSDSSEDESLASLAGGDRGAGGMTMRARARRRSRRDVRSATIGTTGTRGIGIGSAMQKMRHYDEQLDSDEELMARTPKQNETIGGFGSYDYHRRSTATALKLQQQYEQRSSHHQQQKQFQEDGRSESSSRDSYPTPPPESYAQSHPHSLPLSPSFPSSPAYSPRAYTDAQYRSSTTTTKRRHRASGRSLESQKKKSNSSASGSVILDSTSSVLVGGHLPRSELGEGKMREEREWRRRRAAEKKIFLGSLVGRIILSNDDDVQSEDGITLLKMLANASAERENDEAEGRSTSFFDTSRSTTPTPFSSSPSLQQPSRTQQQSRGYHQSHTRSATYPSSSSFKKAPAMHGFEAFSHFARSELGHSASSFHFYDDTEEDVGMSDLSEAEGEGSGGDETERESHGRERGRERVGGGGSLAARAMKHVLEESMLLVGRSLSLTSLPTYFLGAGAAGPPPPSSVSGSLSGSLSTSKRGQELEGEELRQEVVEGAGGALLRSTPKSTLLKRSSSFESGSGRTLSRTAASGSNSIDGGGAAFDESDLEGLEAALGYWRRVLRRIRGY